MIQQHPNWSFLTEKWVLRKCNIGTAICNNSLTVKDFTSSRHYQQKLSKRAVRLQTVFDRRFNSKGMFMHVRSKGVTSTSTKSRGHFLLSIPNSLHLLVCCFSIFRTRIGKDKCRKAKATSPLVQPGGKHTSSPSYDHTENLPQAGKQSSEIYKTIPPTRTVSLSNDGKPIPESTPLGSDPRRLPAGRGRSRCFARVRGRPAPPHTST